MDFLFFFIVSGEIPVGRFGMADNKPRDIFIYVLLALLFCNNEINEQY